jgi:hexosaminidase
LNEVEKKDIAKTWKQVLDELACVNLPEDLEFIRECLKVGVRRVEGKAAPSDFITLANLYSRLWLAERKPEGLERIVERFWGAAGRTDMGTR